MAEARTLGVAAAIEGVRIGAALALLPRPVAIDVIWPVYILTTFDAAARHPGWYGWAMGIGQYLNPTHPTQTHRGIRPA